MEFQRGDLIGRVRIRNLLGQGGMGSVYKGYDEILGRTVALKVADAEGGILPLDKMRFLREARALSRLEHPNICRIYDLIERPDTEILVLEYIAGHTLKSALHQKTVNHRDKLEIARTLANVLEATHSLNIIHRDLKPENIMLTDDRRLKVLDFGLARDIDDERHNSMDFNPAGMSVDIPAPRLDEGSEESLTMQHGGILGTLRYMSPEQARGETTGASSDIFSLGMILFEMFVGKSVYEEGLALPALLFAVGQGKMVNLPLLDENIDPDLANLIRSLIAFEERERPDAKETARRLQEILDKPARIRRKKRLLTSGVLALVLMIGGFFWVRHTLEKPVLLKADETANVLMLPFANRTDDSSIDWVQWGLRDMAATTLSHSPRVECISDKQVKSAIALTGVEGVTPLSRANIEELGKALGSNFTVRTLIENSPEGYLLRFTLYDAYGPARSYSIQAPSLPPAARRMAQMLETWISGETKVEPMGWSSHDMVNQLYAMGLQRRKTEGSKVAEIYYKVCNDLDPSFKPALASRSSALIDMGELEEAEALIRQLLDSGLGEEDFQVKLECYVSLSKIAKNSGDMGLSENYLNDALNMAANKGLNLKTAEIYNQMAILKRHQKQYKHAEDFFKQAASIYQKIGNLKGRATVLQNLGVVASDQGMGERAGEYYQDALKISRDLHDRSLSGTALINLGVLEWERGEHRKAEQYYLQALTIQTELNHPMQQGIIYNNLAGLADIQENHELAEERFLKAVKILTDAGNKPYLAMTYYNLSEHYLSRDRCEEVTPYMDLVREWYKDDPDAMMLSGKFEFCSGRYTEALEWLEKAKAAYGRAWDQEKKDLYLRYQQAVQRGGPPSN